MQKFKILFGGETVPVTLVDGTVGRVHVRALPQQHLAHVVAFAEDKSALVELVSYFRDAPAKGKDDRLDATVRADGSPRFADIETPSGYKPVPLGWSANLTDESFIHVAETADRLNLQRAIEWARRQIAAKKIIAPVYEATVEQVLPLVDRIAERIRQPLERVRSSSNTPAA